jgi:hypothetical protein
MPDEVYPTQSEVTVTVVGAPRDLNAIVHLVQAAIEELSSGRWGEPPGELGTLLEVRELGSGGSKEARYLHLQLRRHAAGPLDVR